MDEFNFKNFEKVRLKATYTMSIGGKTFEAGETIAMFDKIQIAGLQEISRRFSATGGFNNRAQVYWESVKEISLTFAQGVFNKTDFSLLANSNVINRSAAEPILITWREILESDEDNQITLKYMPSNYEPIFVYNKETGAKLTFTRVGKVITISSPYTEVIVDYRYSYAKPTSEFILGQKYFNGFLELEGLTSLKDDETGHVVTGILRIPKLKLMSDLSIRLGAQANPIVANFTASGIPVGSKGSAYVSEFYILDDDIQSDL